MHGGRRRRVDRGGIAAGVARHSPAACRCPTKPRASPLRRADLDLGAVLEARKAGRHHDVGRRHALGDDGKLLVLLRDGDGAHGNLVIAADDVDEGAFGAALHRRGRDHDHLFQRVEEQAHVDELARPQLQVLVGEVGLEADGAGRLIDLVVDHLELAGVEHVLAVGLQRLNLQRVLGHRPVDVGQVLLGQGEQYGDRLHLGDDDDAALGSAHEVADVDQAHAGATRDRGDDARIAEHRARVLDGGIVRFNLRLELRDQRALSVDRLGGDDVG